MPGPLPTEPAATPGAVFAAWLPRIDRIITRTARRLALGRDEAEDFGSWVRLRLIEDDYRVIRGFAGRSSIATYLTAVVQNLACDYRMRHWGRWRPSAAAERLGVEAVWLEVLRERDGFSLDEAVEKLLADYGTRRSRAELVDLAGRLPRRVRTRLEGGDGLDEVASDARADQRVEDGDRRAALARAGDVLKGALAELDLTDRLLLRMHYGRGLRISSIARALGLKQRELYTRRDRCVRRLRREILSRGLDGSEVLAAVGWPEADFELDFGVDLPEEPHPVPSKDVDREAEDPT